MFVSDLRPARSGTLAGVCVCVGECVRGCGCEGSDLALLAPRRAALVAGIPKAAQTSVGLSLSLGNHLEKGRKPVWASA